MKLKSFLVILKIFINTASRNLVKRELGRYGQVQNIYKLKLNILLISFNPSKKILITENAIIDISISLKPLKIKALK